MGNDIDELSRFTRDIQPKAKNDDPRHYQAFTTEPRTQTLRICRKNGIDDYQSWAGFMKASREILQQGTFTELGNGFPGGELNKMFGS